MQPKHVVDTLLEDDPDDVDWVAELKKLEPTIFDVLFKHGYDKIVGFRQIFFNRRYTYAQPLECLDGLYNDAVVKITWWPKHNSMYMELNLGAYCELIKQSRWAAKDDESVAERLDNILTQLNWMLTRPRNPGFMLVDLRDLIKKHIALR